MTSGRRYEDLEELDAWERRFHALLENGLANSDVAHDVEHLRRVVASAKTLALAENARMEIVLPGAWLHDCANIPKDSPERARASSLSAEMAGKFLRKWEYPQHLIPEIQHAIEAHSFSAGISPRTLEARVVQDADRLDALGAIGIARCLMLGGALNRRLYAPHRDVGEAEAWDDSCFVVDHFYVKLFKLEHLMTTESGRREARRRTAAMREYLRQLDLEIRGDFVGDQERNS